MYAPPSASPTGRLRVDDGTRLRINHRAGLAVRYPGRGSAVAGLGQVNDKTNLKLQPDVYDHIVGSGSDGGQAERLPRRLKRNYRDLVREWNACVPLINGRTQPVGRRLAASEARVAEVLDLRKHGFSLRCIAYGTRLG